MSEERSGKRIPAVVFVADDYRKRLALEFRTDQVSDDQVKLRIQHLVEDDERRLNGDRGYGCPNGRCQHDLALHDLEGVCQVGSCPCPD